LFPDASPIEKKEQNEKIGQKKKKKKKKQNDLEKEEQCEDSNDRANYSSFVVAVTP